MSITNLSFTSPDVALVAEVTNADGDSVAIASITPGSVLSVATSNYVSHNTYTTLSAALAAAVAINANYDGSELFGELVFTADDVSDAVLRPEVGDAVTLSSVYTVNQAGSTTFTYKWYKNEILITGATAGTVSTSSFDVNMRGSYRCEVEAENSTNSTKGIVNSYFDVIEPLPSVTAAFAIGGA